MKRHLALQTSFGTLHGHFESPDFPRGLILIPRTEPLDENNPAVVNLAASGYAILAAELLTSQEMHFVDADQNVPRLAQRIIDFLDLMRSDGDMQNLSLGIYATGSITPAAIRAAAQRDTQVKALVCRGGLVDRAGLQSLDLLAAPLLMMFASDDRYAPVAFDRARPHLTVTHEKHLIEPGETPLLRVSNWFGRHLPDLR